MQKPGSPSHISLNLHCAHTFAFIVYLLVAIEL